LKLSIIGAGTMGTTCARNAAKLANVQAAGVCDLIKERAERCAELCGTTAYTDIDEMIAKEQPEVAVVCLPTYLHKNAVLKLAEHGIHVICEKPIAMNEDDAREMQEACVKHGVRFFIGHVVRFFPNYRDALARVRRGEIGEPGIAHLKRYSAYPTGYDGWYRDQGKSGGVIVDLMIHDIDFARALFGEVKSVYASINRSESMDYAQVTMEFTNGRIANLTGYWGYPGPFTTQYEIAGDQGIIQFDSNDVRSLDVKLQKQGTEAGASVPVPSSPANHDPYYYELKHFLECITTGSEPIVTAEDARKALAVALAAEQSAKLRKPVELEVAP